MSDESYWLDRPPRTFDELEDFILWESEIRNERSRQETLRLNGWCDGRDPDHV